MTPNDKRDLEMVAQGRSPVGDAMAAMARANLEIHDQIADLVVAMEAIRKGMAEPEHSVTPQSEVGKALASVATADEWIRSNADPLQMNMNEEKETPDA